MGSGTFCRAHAWLLVVDEMISTARTFFLLLRFECCCACLMHSCNRCVLPCMQCSNAAARQRLCLIERQPWLGSVKDAVGQGTG
ncbi:hypothetical protein COO60DRAFT_895122 [Scenedesmus sp. NREL 46B-D3]|nr:hypothetical protein COO60DRAFT_895122 [Scenedesmus sp. NREL 46B-D3]